MGVLVKKFLDNSYLEYDRGKFDEWCVYLVQSNGSRKPPLDKDYFSELKNLGNKYGNDVVYNNYVKIYNITGKELDSKVFQVIEEISKLFINDILIMEKILSILYMAMIAEENKKYTKLGKRIKRLGIYKLLIEGCDVYQSANFMRGMNWRQIDSLCKERGF